MKRSRRKRGDPDALTPWQSVQYYLLRGFSNVFGRLSVRARRSLARGLGSFVARALPIRRAIVLDHLRLAFPDWDESRRREFLPKVYENLISFGLELCALTVLSREEIDDAFGAGPSGGGFAENIQPGQAVIAISGHIGNWEWGGAVAAARGIDLGVVAKPMHNPATERFIRDLREKLGFKIFTTDQNPKRLISHLKKGGALAFLVDQDARHNGIFCDFFGRAASTATGPAWLAQRYGIPIVPFWTYRTPDGKFRLVQDKAIYADPDAPAEEEAHRLTQYHVSCLERAVKEDPAQYFWFHRRWKTQPQPEPAEPDTAPPSKTPVEEKARAAARP